MANELLENLNKRSSELAERGQKIFNSAYQKGIDRLGLDDDGMQNRLGQIKETRTKIETTLQQTVSEQLRELQSLESKLLLKLEDALKSLQGTVNKNYGRLSDSLGKLENRIREVEQSVSSRLDKMPIENYDQLNAEDIVRKLDELSGDQLELVRGYEADNKGRVTVLKAIDAKCAA